MPTSGCAEHEGAAMIKLPRKVAYVFEALVELARTAGSGPLASRALAERQQIPARYLEQALQRLVRDGILEGVRGPRGGYRLARRPDDIPLSAVVRATLEAEGESPDSPYETKSEIGAAVIQPLFLDLERSLMQRLGALTVADLVVRADQAGALAVVGRAHAGFKPMSAAAVPTS
ncbi:hypothetical protein CKO24_11135 [Rhodothalassium salexigens DSM 2132]|nr:hypothetical protein [Rhodothalassium salexigens DSM 2132]